MIVPPVGGQRTQSEGHIVTWLERTSKKAEAAAKKAFEKTLGNLFDDMD